MAYTIDTFRDVIVRMDLVAAEQDGRIIGWGFLDKQASEVEAVFVDPDSQRNGVGSQILAILEDSARKAGLA